MGFVSMNKEYEGLDTFTGPLSERWLVCGSNEHVQRLSHALAALRANAEIQVVEDVFSLRECLDSESFGPCSVLVGDSIEGVDAVNLAAALVRDGKAERVVLASDRVTGSLASRVRLAGIDALVDAGEPEVALAEYLGVFPASRVADVEAAVLSNSHDAVPTEDIDEPDAFAPFPGDAPAAPSATQFDATAPILCYASGRGGVGKTTIIAATAAVAASWGLKVACLDFDLCFGNLFSAFGIDGPADLGGLHEKANGAVLGSAAILNSAKRSREGVDVFGPCELPEYAEHVQLYAGEIIRCLAGSYDLVLVDTSPAWSDACALTVQVADRVFLVSDQVNGGESSLAKASGLAVRLGVSRTRIVRLVNRCDRKREVEDGLMRSQKGLEVARIHRISNDPDVRELFSAGHIAQAADVEGPFGRSVAAYAAATLSELGCLPECEAAQAALDYRAGRKGGLWFLGGR